MVEHAVRRHQRHEVSLLWWNTAAIAGEEICCTPYPCVSRKTKKERKEERKTEKERKEERKKERKKGRKKERKKECLEEKQNKKQTC